jgi:hypothetical protein
VSSRHKTRVFEMELHGGVIASGITKDNSSPTLLMYLC